MSSTVSWKSVTRSARCIRCGQDGWCARSGDGAYEICRRIDTGDGQERLDKHGVPFWLYRVDGAPVGKISLPDGPPTPADPATLNKIYRDMLAQLELGDGHRGQLHQRGLTDEEIQRYGFRSSPKSPARVAQRLHRDHGDVCAQVPGWHLRDGQPWLAMTPGILVPIWDMDGRCIAIHIRRDRADGDDGSKYVWLTSARAGGPSPGCPPFACWPAGLYQQGNVQCQDVWLVEGEFKAILLARDQQQIVISVPGVSLWKLALPILERCGARRVRLAYDSDWQSRDPGKASSVKHVSRAILTAWKGMREEGYEVALATWPLDRGKGIDDLLQAGYHPEVLADRENWPTLRRIAQATGAYSGGQTRQRGLPEFIPSIPPSRAKATLECFSIDQHSPYSDEVLDAYVMSRKTAPDLRNQVRSAIKRKFSPISDWDAAVKEREAVMHRFWGEEMRLQAKADPTRSPSRLMAQLEESCPHLPTVRDYDLPMGYEVSADGVVRLESSGEEEPTRRTICPAPALLVARLWDVDQDMYHLRMAWWRDEEWKVGTWERASLAQVRDIVPLSNRGLPVDSNTASGLIEYLSASENANISRLPRATLTDHMGWQGRDGAKGFVVGRTRVRPDGSLEPTLSLNSASVDEWGTDRIAFAAEGGAAQMAGAFRLEGDMGGWLEAIAPVSDYPRVQLVLYASFCAPLLEILKAPPFTVDLSYTTSAGKTTALRVAASVWGTPDERDPCPMIGSWESTRVHVERSLGLCNGLPLILDDTARAQKPEFIAKVVYDVSSGRGRGRGSRMGIAESLSWRTLMLSTGEQKITHFASLGGAHARAICLWGQPFNEQSGAAGRAINRLYSGLLAHHGHAGLAWASWLLGNRDRWPEWRERFRVSRDAFLTQADDNPVAGRFSDYLASLELSKQLVHEAIEMPWPEPYDLLAELRPEILREAGESDRALAALEMVLGWVASRPEAFWDRDDTGKPVPAGGWLGRWDYDKAIGVHHDSIAIFPHHLRTRLEQSGFHHETTIRTWRDRGWLDSGTGDRTVRNVRIDRTVAKMVCIRRLAQ